MMKEVENQIAEVVTKRLGDFLRAAEEEDPAATKDVYAASFLTGSSQYYDYLFLEFMWNTNLTWENHKKRPFNKGLKARDKWIREEWVWHPGCEHTHNQQAKLFRGSDGEDQSLQEKLRIEVGGSIHEALIRILCDVVAPFFRRHPTAVSKGIADIPIFIEIDGDEEEALGYRVSLVEVLNPNGEAKEFFESWKL